MWVDVRSRATFEKSWFVDNHAWRGGAVTAVSSNRPNFTSCVFQKNNASSGGAVHLGDNADVAFESNRFDHNHATSGHGGAIFTEAPFLSMP